MAVHNLLTFDNSVLGQQLPVGISGQLPVTGQVVSVSVTSGGIGSLETYSPALGNIALDIGTAPNATIGACVFASSGGPLAAIACDCANVGVGAGGIRVAIYDSEYNLLEASGPAVVPALGLNVLPLAASVLLVAGSRYYFAVFADRAGASFRFFSPTGESDPRISWFITGVALWGGGGPPEGYFGPVWMGGV